MSQTERLWKLRVPVTGVEQVSPFCLVRLQRGGGGMVCSFSVTKHSVSVWTVNRPVPAVWSKEPWNKLQAVRPRFCDLYRRPCSQHKWKNKYLLSLQEKHLNNTTVPCNNELNSVIFIRFRNILLGLLRALTLCYIKLVQVRFNKSFATSKTTQSASVTELKWFTLFWEIIAIYFERIRNTQLLSVGKIQSYWFLKQEVHIVATVI
jgi:hypothetical protein